MKSIKCTLLLGTLVGLSSCSIDMPKETQSSFETMKVVKSDIELPYKFSAIMRGQNDVTVTPQVSGQLMKICVAEGEVVKKGQTLFIIDSRNAQLELEAAEANLQAAMAQENSAKLEYESNKNLFEKKIVSSYMLSNSENLYKQAQAAVAQARAVVNRAKVELGFCTIKANVTGVIGEIPVRIGDQVSPMTQLTMLSHCRGHGAGRHGCQRCGKIYCRFARGHVHHEEWHGVPPQRTRRQPDGCGECRHRLPDLQGLVPQSRRASLFRNPGNNRHDLR